MLATGGATGKQSSTIGLNLRRLRNRGWARLGLVSRTASPGRLSYVGCGGDQLREGQSWRAVREVVPAYDMV
jgi:hypothetical protein